jgi:uncharacterized protein
MEQRISPFSLLVKPAGADCNLHCGYCFYLAKAGLYPEHSRPRMALETAEAMLRSYFSLPLPEYSFGWQGGEPTLMGVDFFREVFEMQRRLAPRGARVTNGFQTNGVLLTAEWAELFREYDVLVGLSIDGPADLHNAHRRWARGGEQIAGSAGDTHARVEESARLLRRERVAFNALTVVGRHNEHAAVEVYEYLKSLRIRHMQFIPLVEWAEGRDASCRRRLHEASVTPEGWGAFLNAIFDRWFPKDVRRVSVRHHDSLLELLVAGRHNVCTTSGVCGGHLVVEHTGDVYPCDFYVDPELRLGNVHASADRGSSNAFVTALGSNTHRAFIRRKGDTHADCGVCRYRGLCHGDCPRLRPGNRARGRSQLCEGWKTYYDHTLPTFRRLARSVADQHGVDVAMPRAGHAE